MLNCNKHKTDKCIEKQTYRTLKYLCRWKHVNLTGPLLKPACLGCLQPLSKMDPALVYFCPKCNLPLCSPNCEFLAQHESQECIIFSENKLMENTKIDTTKPSSIYNCVAIVRMMLKLHSKNFDVATEEALKLMTHLDKR